MGELVAADSESLSRVTPALLAFDKRAVVCTADENARRFFGRSADQLLGLHCSELLSVELDELRRTSVDPTLGPGHDAIGRRGDGSTFAAWVRINELSTGDGPLFLATVDDVERRQQAISARTLIEERLSRLLDLARVLPWEADPETGQFTWVGNGAEALLGFPLRDWYTHNFWADRIHPEDRERIVSYCSDACRKHLDYEAEYRLIAKDGRVVWVYDVIHVTTFAGEPRFLSGFMVDITERKAAEARQAELRDQLRDALRDREEFIALAGHELRTPLTPLKLRLHGLRRTLREHGIDTAGLDGAMRDFNRIQSLVETMLDAARLAHGRVTIEPEQLDLAEVVRVVAEAHRDAAVRHGSELRVDARGPIPANLSRRELEKLVAHLLSNAIKFGAGREIDVAVAADGGRANLVVTDHGIGLSQGSNPRIFERFGRAVDASNYGGLGLGLFISREIVEALGGTIAVQSNVGGGAEFTVTLPLHTERH